MNWVVKASKLCNLRCRYCYEWDELARRDRMALENWEHLLHSIRWYHEHRVASLGPPYQSRIIWHGGEPLLLPPEYISAVMSLQRRVLGADALRDGEYFNALQTNLYSVSNEMLDLLERERVSLGVSMDVAGGVRLSAAGRETEERVARNMDRLRDRGIPFGAIVVLAGHTVDRVTEIYDFYESIGVNVRFLPIFDSPLNTPDASFAITDAQVLDAFQRLFVHWAARPQRVAIDPFREYLDAVMRHRMGRSQFGYDRRTNGEWALLVNTDGTLYQVMDAYDPAKAMGNIFTTSMSDILRSEMYDASLVRDETLVRACDGCEFRGPCTSLPLFDSARSTRPASRCHVAYPMLQFIDAYCTERGLTAEQVRELVTCH